MYGDFEAQRHWIEITNALPRHQWYKEGGDNDLQYWGLDYPPLTAFHSWAMGRVAWFGLTAWYGNQTVASHGSDSQNARHQQNEQSKAEEVFAGMFGLHYSRGSESVLTKSFMRWSALIADLLVYFPAAFLLVRHLSRVAAPERSKPVALWSSVHWVCFTVGLACLLILLPFPLILIDHGHFQYNSISLGLMLWYMLFAVTPIMFSQHRLALDTLALISFWAAILYKQMSLYYIPAVGCYFLGEALTFGGGRRGIVKRLIIAFVMCMYFAFVTAICFAVGFGPFVETAHNSSDGGFAADRSGVPSFPSWQALLEGPSHVLSRMFPFKRGLYEDKVANFWCAVSVVWKMPKFVDEIVYQGLATEEVVRSTVVKICAATTFFAALPSCIGLLRFMIASASSHVRFSTLQFGKQLARCLAASALSFFLFSFQVHEKSILLPWLPVSVLCIISLIQFVSTQPSDPRRIIAKTRYAKESVIALHFCLVSLFSMYPLVVKDGLLAVYFAFFAGLAGCTFFASTHLSGKQDFTSTFLFVLSVFGMIILHLADALFTPPSRYPDLITLAFVGYSCIHFLVYWFSYTQRCLTEARNAELISAESARLAAKAAAAKAAAPASQTAGGIKKVVPPPKGGEAKAEQEVSLTGSTQLSSSQKRSQSLTPTPEMIATPRVPATKGEPRDERSEATENPTASTSPKPTSGLRRRVGRKP